MRTMQNHRHHLLVTVLLLLLLHVFNASCSQSTDLSEDKPKTHDGICDPREYFDSDNDDPTAYWQCSPKSDDWNGVGEWERRSCPSGHNFVRRTQRCTSTSNIRRQQPICSTNSFNSFACLSQPTRCTVGVSKPQIGAQCDWQTVPLARDPFSSAYFLQCTPAATGSLCGVWQRRPCLSGTTFDLQVQVCVTTSVQGSCPSNTQAVCPCSAVQPVRALCPASCTCVQNACCLPVVQPVVQPTYPLPVPQPTYAVRCPDGTPSRGNCVSSIECGGGAFVCISGSCCIVQTPIQPTQPLPTCPDGSVTQTACTTTGVCPPSQFCYQGRCCSLGRCPAGDIPVQVCNSVMRCPLNTQCINNGCCPIPLPVCPNGVTASRACRVDNPTECDFAATGQYCYLAPNGYAGCCPSPRCPNGVVSQGACTSSTSCPVGSACINGACCPIPRCPDGAVAIQPCTGVSATECPSGFICLDGSCCAARCGDGSTAVGSCPLSATSCAAGSTCQSGVCCPLVICPNGQRAIEPCVGTGVSTCPTGYGCYQGGCCRVALCLNGEPSVQACVGTGQANCPLGYSCTNEMCCRSPTCPAGELALQVCAVGTPNSCPLGFECINGGCCRVAPAVPLPQCPNGLAPVGPCVGPGAYGGQCLQPGTVCMNGACCPQMPTTCPNGQQATQPCTGVGQGTCPTGFECFAGGCCPLSLSVAVTNGAQCHSAAFQPICYCAAYNYACPPSTVCQSGLCCAGQSSPLYNTVRPGDRCSSSIECPGPYANCVNGYCICTGNSRSNGVQCVPFALQTRRLRKYKPGETCGQFAMDCGVFDGTDKRDIKRLASNTNDAMRELGIHKNDEPIFWYVAKSAKHYCKTDADCTPDMTCIQNRCLAYLAIGERGCSASLQCSRTTIGSRCEFDHAINTTLCKCQPDWLYHDKACVRNCPLGFRTDGLVCVAQTVRHGAERSDTPRTALTDFTDRLANLFSSPSQKRTSRRNRE